MTDHQASDGEMNKMSGGTVEGEKFEPLTSNS